jgi:hypothetical protein
LAEQKQDVARLSLGKRIAARLIPIWRRTNPFLTDYKVCMAFESLGENCEFGFVQSHFGAEPLGLLRFSGVTVDQLIDALDHDFEGVGEPDQTEVHLNPEGGEYLSIDTRYRFSSHSMVLANAATEAEAAVLIQRRGKFLKRKMLEDLRSPLKIYVFQSPHEIAATQMLSLLSALRRHGPARLLFVRPDPDPALQGTATQLEEGLMLGYTDRPGNADGVWAPSHALWIRLLRHALKLCGAERAARLGL